MEEVSDDKELYRHLGRISNEIVQIQNLLQRIDDQETRLRSALDDLTLEKNNLAEKTNCMELMLKEAVNSALEDAERERQVQSDFAVARSGLQSQIQTMEQALQAKEMHLTELEQSLTDERNNLNQEIKKRDDLLEFREMAIKDLKSAVESMNFLVDGLTSLRHPQVISLEQAQTNSEAEQKLNEIQENLSREIDKLKRELHDKNLLLAAKDFEIERIQEASEGKIKDLERAVSAKKKRRSPSLTTFFSRL